MPTKYVSAAMSFPDPWAAYRILLLIQLSFHDYLLKGEDLSKVLVFPEPIPLGRIYFTFSWKYQHSDDIGKFIPAD